MLGGSAAVWNTALVFFQTALLAGYTYAHLLTTRCPRRAQPWVHFFLLALALCVLPVMPGDRWKPAPAGDPALQILAMLTAVLGLPYLALSATSPLLQKWLSRGGSQPYRLFALSNAGALLALAAYPIWIEPRMTTRAQDSSWSAGFAIFAILCAASAWLSVTLGKDVPVEPEAKTRFLSCARNKEFHIRRRKQLFRRRGFRSAGNRLTEELLPLATFAQHIEFQIDGLLRDWNRE